MADTDTAAATTQTPNINGKRQLTFLRNLPSLTIAISIEGSLPLLLYYSSRADAPSFAVEGARASFRSFSSESYTSPRSVRLSSLLLHNGLAQ